MTTYKIGTRGSLLAVTQSTLIKNQLEALTGEKFELVTIKTQGDQITDRPLWQLEGKDFFTKELDEALLKGEVDLVIHSYKDLGSERPAGIKLAAVTERRFAHDVLLIPQHNIDKLSQWQEDFVVGTSSPRRIVNLTHSLADYLPHLKQRKVKIRCETLRGNINSRIRKLKEGQYHAITLALAGVERLAHTEKSASELAELLSGLNYLVLPQSVFPAAASQGALGIEMREDRQDGGKLQQHLQQLVHARTVEEVQRERKSFKDFGGGCHLAVGIHVKKINDDLFLHVNSGEVDHQRVEQRWLEGLSLPALPAGKKLFVGFPTSSQTGVVCDEYLKKIPETKTIDLKDKHVFVTSMYCLETLKASIASGPQGIWAAGAKSARDLAARGHWVNGTADSLGVEDLKSIKGSRALQMVHPHLAQDWVVLTHPASSSELGPVVGCYERHKTEVSEAFVEQMKLVGGCFWTSYPQYQAYLEKFPFLKAALQFCGLGKTWQEFRAAGVNVYPVANMQDLYTLVRK
jgi:hydroxymethylbilane synthase